MIIDLIEYLSILIIKAIKIVVNADILHAFKDLAALLYNASPLIFVNELLFPVIVFILLMSALN